MTLPTLPLFNAALEVGFGSFRRFNAAFSEVYKRPPDDTKRRKPG